MNVARPRRGLMVVAVVVAVGAFAAEMGRRSQVGPWHLEAGSDDGATGGFTVPGPNCAGLHAYLERDAGETIDAATLAAAASKTRVALEQRMDEVAARVGVPGSGIWDSSEVPSGREAVGWRAVFELVAQAAPATVDETLALYRSELARSEAFVRERALVEIPIAPLVVTELRSRLYEESFPLAVYFKGGTLGVITRAGGGEHSAYLRNHCLVCVPPLAVHEGVPGHHVAFALGTSTQALENAVAVGEVALAAQPEPGPPINLVVQEGWALYAEVLMGEQGYWVDDPALELGALRMVFWRAVRAFVDAELHCGTLSRAAAEGLYQRELGMTPDAASTELNRHLLAPGTKASYFVGASQILALREALGVGDPGGPTLADFHGRLLRDPKAIPLLARERFGIEPPTFSAPQRADRVQLIWGTSP